MTEWITLILMWIGAVFMLLAATGLLRLPDTFTRMQAATKAGTLGVSSMMLATATHFGDLGVTARALLTVAFVFATAPVAAHLIGRVAYIVGAEMWHGTVIDELRSRYEARRRGIGEFDDAPTPPGTGGGSSDRIREENPD